MFYAAGTQLNSPNDLAIYYSGVVINSVLEHEQITLLQLIN